MEQGVRSPQPGGAATSAPPASRLKKDDKYLQGRNGRLFLHNDYNQAVRQHRGELLFSEHELRHWRLLLETRIAMLDRLGIRYFLLVPPNAHAVYPEDLPEEARGGDVRPVLQLIHHLAGSDSPASLIYPLDEILAAKPRNVYPKGDSHWTAIGAFAAYRRLVDEIAPVAHVHPLGWDDVRFTETMRMGELGFKLDPAQESEDVAAWIPAPEAYLTFDNRVFNTGSIVSTECPAAPPTGCLVMGDSFSNALWPFLAASFGRFTFAHTPSVDYDFVREHEVDVVVSVLNERFVILIPDDLGGPTVRQLEAEKQEHGDYRRQTGHWRPREEAG